MSDKIKEENSEMLLRSYRRGYVNENKTCQELPQLNVDICNCTTVKSRPGEEMTWQVYAKTLWSMERAIKIK